jgi:predicted RNA binding protein YcfA (HicA-like mRNA interferase family)
MSKKEKAVRRILDGTMDPNIPFDELTSVLRELGFEERVRGSHHIFAHPDFVEIINLQPVRGEAKPYQVRQVRRLILRHGFGGRPNAE